MPIRRLPKNGVIAITSPSSPVVPERLERGVAYLEGLGYRVEVAPSNYASDHYFAGGIRERADELNQLFSDPKIDAIICGRGGFGSMYLLPHLDYATIGQSSKLFIGFSDITALQWGIWAKTKMPSLSAGMVATDMANEPVNADFEAAFWEVVESGKCRYELPPSNNIDRVEGTALPGTVAVAAKMVGTEWFPDVTGSILILEDVDEPMHKVDGYLGQFRMAGFFEKAAGTVLGTFSPVEKEPYPSVPTLDAVIDRIFDGVKAPLGRHTRYGHIKQKIAVPCGLPICVSLGQHSEMYNPISLVDF
jgi:muramoyltetrapeptide carboxypeptidase